MFSSDDKHQSHWDIQVSIAKAIAHMENPSLMKLHHNIMEEFGHRPGLDLIDYFIGITETVDGEVQEYLNYIGAAVPQQKTKETKKDPGLLMADKIALTDNPTVLRFRQAFITEFDEPPPDQLTNYFLKKIQDTPQKKKVYEDKDTQFHFAEAIANRPNSTILKFRHEFSRKYGVLPSSELTGYFLKKLKRNNSPQEKEKDYKSQVNFAKTVANRIIPTVLQFRKTFEKAYGIEPSVELVDIFIKNLPNKGKESG